MVAGLVIAVARQATTTAAPAPPPEGQHGDVRYETIAAQGSIRATLQVSASGTFTVEVIRKGLTTKRSGQLSDADRALLADVVGQASRVRVRTRYDGGGADYGSTTVTFGGLTVRLVEEPSPDPPELRRLLDSLWTLALRLADAEPG